MSRAVGDIRRPDPLLAWGQFAQLVPDRLDKGRTEYHDRSFARAAAELLEEIQQEALDLAGWGFVLWHRLETMRPALEPDKGEEIPS